jgi:hypothetical protein
MKKTIKNLTLLAVSALAITLLFRASITIAQTGHWVPFKATFHGFAERATPTEDPDVVEIVVPLQGTATHLGKFDERLVHRLNPFTGEFTGHADWTAADGSTLTTVFNGQLYPTEDRQLVTFEVTHTIVGGTGRFKGATGTFKGVNGLFNLETGEDQGGYLGALLF